MITLVYMSPEYKVWVKHKTTELNDVIPEIINIFNVTDYAWVVAKNKREIGLIQCMLQGFSKFNAEKIIHITSKMEVFGLAEIFHINSYAFPVWCPRHI